MGVAFVEFGAKAQCDCATEVGMVDATVTAIQTAVTNRFAAVLDSIETIIDQSKEIQQKVKHKRTSSSHKGSYRRPSYSRRRTYSIRYKSRGRCTPWLLYFISSLIKN